jgi:thiamine pyrophosphokinase
LKSIQPKSILIIANGLPPQQELTHKLTTISDCVIAADGGSNYCYEINLYPHFIIGDLDSLHPKVMTHFKDAEIIHLGGQETHDLEKAIEFAITLKPEIIRIVAAFGLRLDHTMANLITLQIWFKQANFEFYDNFGRLTVVTGTTSHSFAVGSTVSLFSFLPIYGVSLEGFRYSLFNQDFPNGFIGLSNVVSAAQSKISIKNGYLFLYINHENTTTHSL